jgi:hypothetical protein
MSTEKLIIFTTATASDTVNIRTVSQDTTFPYRRRDCVQIIIYLTYSQDLLLASKHNSLRKPVTTNISALRLSLIQDFQAHGGGKVYLQTGGGRVNRIWTLS